MADVILADKTIVTHEIVAGRLRITFAVDVAEMRGWPSSRIIRFMNGIGEAVAARLDAAR